MINEMLLKIQSELKVPKNEFNAFGKYNYRSLEGILEAVKPLLVKYKCVLRLTDSVVEIGGRVYVRAAATLYSTPITLANISYEKDDGATKSAPIVEIPLDMTTISVCAYAREPLDQKGMNDSQMTGSASSYARKYALNGLFLIDDTKDADTMDNSVTEKSSASKPPKQAQGDDIKCEKCGAKMYVSKYADKNGNEYYYCSNRDECKHKYWPPKQTAGEQESAETFDATPVVDGIPF